MVTMLPTQQAPEFTPLNASQLSNANSCEGFENSKTMVFSN